MREGSLISGMLMVGATLALLGLFYLASWESADRISGAVAHDGGSVRAVELLSVRGALGYTGG